MTNCQFIKEEMWKHSDIIDSSWLDEMVDMFHLEGIDLDVEVSEDEKYNLSVIVREFMEGKKEEEEDTWI